MGDLIHTQTQRLWGVAIEVNAVAFSGDKQQLAVVFYSRTHCIGVARFDLAWVIREVEWQRHLAFDLTALLGQRHRRGIG